MRGVQKLDLQPWAADVVGSTHDDWLRRNTKPHPDICDLVAERRAFTGSVQAALQVCVHFSISVSFSIDMQAAREAGGACHQLRRSERQFCVDVYARRDRTICLVDPSQRLHTARTSARFTPAAATNRTPAGHLASLKTHGSSRVAASGHSQTCQHAFVSSTA
jgi:hypothetical protein